MVEGIIREVKPHVSKLTTGWEEAVARKCLQNKCMKRLMKRYNGVQVERVTTEFHIYNSELEVRRNFEGNKPISAVHIDGVGICVMLAGERLIQLKPTSPAFQRLSLNYFLFEYSGSIQSFTASSVPVDHILLLLPALEIDNKREKSSGRYCVITTEYLTLYENLTFGLPRIPGATY